MAVMEMLTLSAHLPEVLLEPGQVTEVAFDVGWTSQVFNRGHRIRVEHA